MKLEEGTREEDLMTLKIYPNTYEAKGKLRSFTSDGRRIVINEVIDRWDDEECEYLQLLADDARIYFLRHGKGNHWEVQTVFPLQSLSQWE
jgi:hypothetical protein